MGGVREAGLEVTDRVTPTGVTSPFFRSRMEI
jgi:hypothetical protein